MSTYKILFNAQAALPTDGFVRGPVTTSDDATFLFRNQSSDLDFYFELKKNDQGWYQSGGPEIQHPQHMVDEIGHQIDTFIINNPILNKTDLTK